MGELRSDDCFSDKVGSKLLQQLLIMLHITFHCLYRHAVRVRVTSLAPSVPLIQHCFPHLAEITFTNLFKHVQTISRDFTRDGNPVCIPMHAFRGVGVTSYKGVEVNVSAM
jgi:hypothetical protein